MRGNIASSGFIPPADRSLGTERHSVALAQFVATAGLTLSTIVAALAVSIGIARASIVGNVIDNEGSMFGVALLLGLIFIGFGGVSQTSRRSRKH